MMFICKQKQKMKKQKQKLDNILNITNELVKNSDIKDVRRSPVYALVIAMTKYHLLDIMRELYEDEAVTDQTAAVNEILNDIGVYILDSENLKNTEYFELGKRDIYIDLAKDAVLVRAWDKERFCNALLKIGENVGEPFKFIPCNHKAMYIYPLGLTVIFNGNHSSLAGILKGEGKIQANYTYNLTPTYEYMYFDGVYFRCKKTDSILYEVKRFELGALYEMGRIFLENDVK